VKYNTAVTFIRQPSFLSLPACQTLYHAISATTRNHGMMWLFVVTNVRYPQINKCKKLQFLHKLTASDTSKTAKITKRWYYSAAYWHL